MQITSGVDSLAVDRVLAPVPPILPRRPVMALIFYFDVQGMSPDKYDEVLRRLDAAGAGSPKGRSYHVSFDSSGEVKVVDVWESQEDFDAFGETLVPIL